MATHPHHSQQPELSLDLEEPTGHSAFSLMDFPDLDIRVDPSKRTAPKAEDGLNRSIETTVSSAGSMQTPPPTSTSASRRKAQQAQVLRLVKDSAVKGGRRLSSPGIGVETQQHTHFTQPEESPSHFQNLQFSPDGISFPMSGPATAPVYPQHKLFWDPEQSDTINIDMSMDDTFSTFGLGSHKALDPFALDDDHGAMLPFTTSPAFNTVKSSAGVGRSSHASALNHSNIGPPSALINHGSSRSTNSRTLVNPSILFSSPGRATESAAMPDSETHGHDDDVLQPYAHQIRDAKIEKELKSRKQKRKRAPETGDSPAVKAAIEALREDRTDMPESGPVLADSFVGALPGSRPSANHEMPSRKRMTPESHYRRRDSQLNLHKTKSDKALSNRTAVTLTIEPSGRAVTETMVISDRPRSTNGSVMDVDSASEGSESSSLSSDGRMGRHQQHSFDPTSRQKHVRQARFLDDHRSHAHKSSDASTLASTNTTSTMHSQSGRRHLVMNTGHAQAHLLASQSGHAQGRDDESEAETVIDSDEDNGNAQSALKKVLQQRALKKNGNRSSWSASKPSFPVRHQSYTTAAAAPNPYYTTQNLAPSHLAYQEPPSNISPTTVTDPDWTTPGSGRESNISGNSTRCVCNMADGNGQLMIQW